MGCWGHHVQTLRLAYCGTENPQFFSRFASDDAPVFACRAVRQRFYVSCRPLIFSPFKLSINYTVTLEARNILLIIFYTLVITHQEPHINTVFDSGAGTEMSERTGPAGAELNI